MKVIVDGNAIELGTTQASPTIGIVDYSRRETNDFGVTTVVQRGFSRRMSVRLAVPFDRVDALQRQLADLRATAARWVADEEFASLSFVGFYKDFSIDLAIAPTSFCTLTIEGLADTVAGTDDGADPAPDGATSTLQLLQPCPITSQMLTAINVPENDFQPWNAGSTYDIGTRVVHAHRVWENLVVANIGHEPTAAGPRWLDVGPTNRWAMFDEALGTATQQAGGIAMTIEPGAPVNALALLDVAGGSVRVQTAGYDRTITPASEPGMALFLDMPLGAGAVTVTVTGSAAVSVGTCLLGSLVGLGTTEASPTAAITDYSRKEAGDFGEVTVVERAWAKRMEVRGLLRTDAIDQVADRIASVRARPCLWIGADDVEALSIYGFFKEFTVDVGEHVSTLALSIEGLSKAARLVSATGVYLWVAYADSPDGSVNFTTGSAEGRAYIGIGNNKPVITESSDPSEYQWTRIRGFDGADGAPGVDGAPGIDGADGSTFYTWIAYADSADGTVNFTTGAPSGRAYIGLANNKPTAAESSNPADYVWSQYKGPAGFGLVDFNGNSVCGPNYAMKVAGGVYDWDASVYSSESFSGSAQLSFTAQANTLEIFVGLNTDPTTNASFDSIDYAFFLRGDGQLCTRINGGDQIVHGPYSTVLPMQILYDGRFVRWFHAGDLLRQVEVAANLRFFLDTSFAQVGARINNLTWSSAGKAGADGAPGVDGAPGIDGADGSTFYTWIAYADSADGTVNFTTGAPSGRAFIGLANNKPTAAESSNPADYVWSQYKGPAGFGLVDFNGNSVCGPNYAMKVAGGAYDWDASVYSSESFTGSAQLSFTAQANNLEIFVGLNTDPTTNASFDSIDYAFYLRANGQLCTRINGGDEMVHGPYSTVLPMQILYDGRFVRWFHAGDLLRQVEVAANLRFFLDTSFAQVGARINNLTWSSAGKAGTDGAPGVDGAPGIDGADGSTFYTWIAYADSADGTVNFTTGAPSGRAFIGLANNKPTAAESSNPADYVWSQYKGPAAFGLANFNGNSVCGPNYAMKVAGGAYDWDASVYSSESFSGSAQLSFTAQANNLEIFVGLNTDPTTNASFDSIDYAFYLRADGQLCTRINGSDQIVHGPYSTVLPMQILYDGRFVRWFHAGDLLREEPVPANLRFFLDTSFAQVGARINNLSWTSAGKAGADGAPGVDGAPGINGANGQTFYTWIAYADHPQGVVNFTTGAPAGRSYIGRADNRASPIESIDPADYVWSLYTGPPNFGLVAGENMTVSGARLLKAGGSYAWDAQVYSSESYRGGAFVSWRPEVKDQMMVGLNSDPLTNASYDSLDVAIFVHQTGWDCRINANIIYTHPHDWVLGDSFAIHYTGAEYVFLKNGVACFAASAGAGFTYWLDSSFVRQGLNATILAWQAAGAAGAEGPQGPQGLQGPQGAPGSAGPKGDPAFGFVQDEYPGPGQFVSQTWYQPGAKRLYRWDGGAWQPMLGELATRNLIAESAFLADGVIINAKIGNLEVSTLKLTGQAVDYTRLAQSAKGNQMIRRPFGPGSGPYFYSTATGTIVDSWSITFDYPVWLMSCFGAGYETIAGAGGSSSTDAEMFLSIKRVGDPQTDYGAFATTLQWANTMPGSKSSSGANSLPAGTYDFILGARQFNSDGRFLNGWNFVGLLWGAS